MTITGQPSGQLGSEDTGPRLLRNGRGNLLHQAERFALLGLLILVCIFFSVLPKSSGTFPTSANIAVLTGNQIVTALLAIAEIFPLVSGNFDFSLGGNAAMASCLTAGLMSRDHAPAIVAIAVAVLFGLAVGVVNGVLVCYTRMSSFVTTLGVATLLGGIVTWYTGGQTITSSISQGLINFGSLDWLGLPRAVYLVAVVTLLAWYLLAQTPFGRRLYALGDNPRSARLVGIRVQREAFYAFVLAGLLAGIAGVLLTARNGGATADTGTDLIFPALAAVFLGATAVDPGRFNVLGTVIGVLFVAVAVSGLTLAGVSDWVQPVFNGCALIVAIGLSTYLARRRRGKDAL